MTVQPQGTLGTRIVTDLQATLGDEAKAVTLLSRILVSTARWRREKRQELLHRSAIGAFAAAMDAHPHSLRVAERVCGVLQHILSSGQTIAADLSFLPDAIIPSLVRSMQLHLCARDFAESCCRVFTFVTQYGTGACRSLLDARAVATAVAATSAHPSSCTLVCAVLQLLQAMLESDGNPDLRREIVAAGGIDTTLTAMSKHVGKGDVLCLACRVLVLITANDTALQSCIGTDHSKAFTALLGLLWSHTAFPRVQELAASALATLAVHNENRTLILADDGRGVLERTRAEAKDKRVAAACARALWNLGPKDNRLTYPKAEETTARTLTAGSQLASGRDQPKPIVYNARPDPKAAQGRALRTVSKLALSALRRTSLAQTEKMSLAPLLPMRSQRWPKHVRRPTAASVTQQRAAVRGAKDTAGCGSTPALASRTTVEQSQDEGAEEEGNEVGATGFRRGRGDGRGRSHCCALCQRMSWPCAGSPGLGIESVCGSLSAIAEEVL